jgi:excisionase family DNA binding protein
METSPPTTPAVPSAPGDCSTIEAARLLGMAVRSVQMMVDRGDLQAWKTPGGHRRIARASVDRWLAARPGTVPAAEGASAAARTTQRTVSEPAPRRGLRVLLIEDSAHYQNLVSLLVRQQLPDTELHVADDGIAGLAMAGRLDPDVLLVDILLPGIDGATLITSLRSHPQFKRSRLIVVTSLDEAQRVPYAFALKGVQVVHKTRLVAELPALLAACAAESAAHPRAGG